MNRKVATLLSTKNAPPLDEADLDEELVQTAREILDALLSGSDATLPADSPEAGKTKREVAARNRLKESFKLTRGWRFLGQAAGWVLWLSVLWLFIATLVALAKESGFGACVFPLLSIVIGWLGVYFIGKKEKHFRKQQALAPATLLHILPLFPPQKGMQTAYCDAVIALLKQQETWGRGAAQEILRDLKSLLQTGRQTAARRVEIEQAMSHQSVVDMEAEAARLAVRTEGATDGTARETFKQSMVLLEARLARAKSLEPLRQQLEAQEEVITQALYEAQSALSGASLAHWTLAGGASASLSAIETKGTVVSLTHLGDTVSRLRQQTEAVEQAVQEVIGCSTQSAVRR